MPFSFLCSCLQVVDEKKRGGPWRPRVRLERHAKPPSACGQWGATETCDAGCDSNVRAVGTLRGGCRGAGGAIFLLVMR